jgi:hypothetical protein
MEQWEPIAQLCENQNQARSKKHLQSLMDFLGTSLASLDTKLVKIVPIGRTPLTRLTIFLVGPLLLIVSIASIDHPADRTSFSNASWDGPKPLRPELDRTIYHIGITHDGHYVIQQLDPGDSRWHDIGTFDTYNQAHQILSSSGKKDED